VRKPFEAVVVRAAYPAVVLALCYWALFARPVSIPVPVKETPGAPTVDATRELVEEARALLRADKYAEALAPVLHPYELDPTSHIYAKWLAGESTRRTEVPPGVSKYSRESLAAQLADGVGSRQAPDIAGHVSSKVWTHGALAGPKVERVLTNSYVNVNGSPFRTKNQLLGLPRIPPEFVTCSTI